KKNRITIRNNRPPKRLGTTAIKNINDRYCRPDEINRIALVAPMARVNIIKDFEVTEKLKVEVPDTVEGFVKCVNPQCITNNEPVATAFTVLKGADISLKCRYCEKITFQGQLEIIK
ncbi:MAG: aspartate carbamoyltransferase regulatory subunit, partial [Alistipes sp.]|nr:aspartate carbamoyltransferase regulatory subunit [Alistipes sp.]